MDIDLVLWVVLLGMVFGNTLFFFLNYFGAQTVPV